MVRRALAICVLLAIVPSAGFALSDEEKLIRDYVKTLAKDKDPRERAGAAESLGGRDHPEAVAALAKALSDPEASVRQAAASALWKTGKAAASAKPDLQKALADPDAGVLARVAGALSAMGVSDKELADAWRRALEGARDDATAFVAARGLIGIDPAAKLAPPVLTYLTKNVEEAVRGHRGRSNIDDTRSAEAAAKSLAELLNEKGAAALLPLLDKAIERSPDSGRYILNALGSAKSLPPGTVDLALEHTTSSKYETRYAAISLAGKVKSEREVARWIPEAIRLLGDPEESVRMEAAWVLKGVRGLAHEAAPELARLVAKDRDMGVRARAASALEEIGDSSNPIPKAAKAAVASVSKSALLAAMKDKDHDLAVEAVGAYNKLHLDSAEVVATLADVAVSGADMAARERALQCLRNRQGQAKGIVETIRPLTKSSDKNLAEDARTAIEWIERGGAGSPGSIAAGGSAASAAPPAPAAGKGSKASAPAAAPAVSAASGNEERGLAVLRERKVEFDEPSFYRALSEADAELIRAYLDGGMSAKMAFASSNRRSPLMVLFFSRTACDQGEPGRAIVQLLLERGADVNQQDENKNTALMFAVSNCDRQTIRLLLKAGAKLDHRNGSGLNALEMGIVSGNPGLEELIAAGARLDPQKAKSWSEAYKSNPKALALIKKASAK
jgi:HEAT repeat protein